MKEFRKGEGSMVVDFDVRLKTSKYISLSKKDVEELSDLVNKFFSNKMSNNSGNLYCSMKSITASWNGNSVQYGKDTYIGNVLVKINGGYSEE